MLTDDTTVEKKIAQVLTLLVQEASMVSCRSVAGLQNARCANE